MKTDYFLEKIIGEDETRKALSELLPGQANPWILWGGEGDALAYFHFNKNGEGALSINASISGRHYGKDESALEILRKLQRRIGGTIEDDFGNAI